MAIENIGRLLRVKETPLNGVFVCEELPPLASVANVDVSAMPADGVIAALPFSATPTQAEVEALRDECEGLRDALAAAISTIEAIRDRLQETGGAQIILDG